MIYMSFCSIFQVLRRDIFYIFCDPEPWMDVHQYLSIYLFIEIFFTSVKKTSNKLSVFFVEKNLFYDALRRRTYFRVKRSQYKRLNANTRCEHKMRNHTARRDANK